MKLIWYQRRDGLWNADCACGATCCGVPFEQRAETEVWHLANTDKERVDFANGKKYAQNRRPCGGKFPEEDINNYFEHWIFA